MSRPAQIYSAYDALAWFYNRYWGARFPPMALPILDRLVLRLLPPSARVLDLCCGAGHITKALAARGLKVTGIDGSLEMLSFARQNVPSAEFIQADARAVHLAGAFDAVISTFESMNHVLSVADLAQVSQCVYHALTDQGYFVFDVNTEQAYQREWGKESAIVEDENVCIVRGAYEPLTRLAHTDLTLFRLVAGAWQRSDVRIAQRCYLPSEIESELASAGFRSIRAYDAQRDLQATGEISTGRRFYVARKYVNRASWSGPAHSSLH